MRLIVTAAAVAAGLAGAAQAQTPAPLPVDPAKLALAREVFTANGGAEAFRTQMRAMFGGISQLMTTSMPAGNPALGQALIKDFSEAELEMVPQLIDMSAEVYAQNLTDQELRDTLAWAKSPSGQSIRAKMPGITQQLVVRMGPMIQAMTPKLMQKTIDRACEEAKCTPEARKIMVDAMDKALKPKGS